MQNPEDEFMEYSIALFIHIDIESGRCKEAEDSFDRVCKEYKWKSKEQKTEAKEEHNRIWNKYKNKISNNGK